MACVRVAVRVRPLNEREKQLSSKVAVKVKANSLTIYKPISVSNRGERPKTFFVDFSYDSTDPHSSSFASQETIFNDLGFDVIKAAFEGFNNCIFAYGPTGSGKSYTMMGHEEEKGLIPRICEGLFKQISEKDQSAVTFHTEVSYMEIYNEQVKDLFQNNATSTEKNQLKVREHPMEGPYVENLTRHYVQNYHDLEALIKVGNSSRSTASTNMNDKSSRSHTIFTIRFTCAWFEDSLPRETASKIHLVDLAGSERADATRATGARLKERANINKSLVTLGCVISTLVLFQNIATSKRKKHIFIPYRDSALTWLLKESLGGNSKTTMIANVSPAEANYEETLSTLHYASRAKNIVNFPKVNQDRSVKVIRRLQAEIERLRKLLEEANQVPKGDRSSLVEVEEKMVENEAKAAALNKEWSIKWNELSRILKEETVVLRERRSGLVLDCRLPHLIGIEKDLLGSGIVLYYLKEGETTVGSSEALCGQNIVLQGPGLLSAHCVLHNQNGTVTLIPCDGALCLLDGSLVTTPCPLTQGSLIQLGKSTMFRFNHPTEAALLREKQQSGQLSVVSLSLTDMSKSAENLSKVILQKPGAVTGEKSSVHLREKQIEAELNKSSGDGGGRLSENSGNLLQSTAEDTQEAESAGPRAVPVKVTSVSSNSPETHSPEATPAESAVPHSLDGEAHQGGVRTRDDPKQEGDQCHKSGPELTSEGPQKMMRSGAEEVGCRGEVWSGDASLQQTSVPGRGDGCGIGPAGSANEIQEVTADCYEGRPDSVGNSLSSTPHLQSTEGSKSRFCEQQACTHSLFNKTALSSWAATCPTKNSTTRDPSFFRGMTGVRALERVLKVRAQPSQRLGSLVNTLSCVVKGAGQCIFGSSIVLKNLYPPKNVLSLVKSSYIASLVRDIHTSSFLTCYPLVQHLPFGMWQHLYALSPTKTQKITTNRAWKVQNTPTKEFEKERSVKDKLCCDFSQGQSHEAKSEECIQMNYILENYQTCDSPSTLCKDASVFFQLLITFPDSLLKLHSSHSALVAALQSILPPSMFVAQRVVALFWLQAAKRSEAKAVPALVIVMESNLFAVTENSGALKVFYHLPLVQLKELHIGFAGHSLCLLGPTEESVLGLHMYSQSLCRELCGAVLSLLCPADSRVWESPLLCGDLMVLSLTWEAVVPELVLDTGLKLRCSFQKSLADLSYLLHCNTVPEQSDPGEVRLRFYCCVGICFPSKRRLLGQLFVTDTHIGLVQEDMVFPPVGSLSSEPPRLQFHSLSVRRVCDVRGVVVREQDSRGAVTVDVILANVKGRGHPGCAHPSSQLWKLTFSCCTEAARLINHLSNV